MSSLEHSLSDKISSSAFMSTFHFKAHCSFVNIQRETVARFICFLKKIPSLLVVK